MNNQLIAYLGVFACLLAGYTTPSHAQKDLSYPGNEDGVSFKSADSSMHIYFNARIQNRLDISSRYHENMQPSEALFQVRRMRLKANGYMIDPRLTFKIELAFSRDDINGHLQNAANILLDASMQYSFTPNLRLHFGQFKLPGNRQRVISSQDLQLVDRSLANAAYNLDRDVGLMLQYQKQLGPALLMYFSALSNGEGRNTLSSSNKLNNNELNLALTQRLEILPFGRFTDEGDYFESDLLRESMPKLSLGAGYFYNKGAIRASGQRGHILYEARNISGFFSDLMFKYQGWSVLAEYLQMNCENPITKLNGNYQAVETGQGYMIQTGYILPFFWEISARYSQILPDDKIKAFQQAQSELLLGVSRYIRGHRIKLQSDVGYIVEENLPQEFQEYWQWRVQMELGF